MPVKKTCIVYALKFRKKKVVLKFFFQEIELSNVEKEYRWLKYRWYILSSQQYKYTYRLWFLTFMIFEILRVPRCFFFVFEKCTHRSCDFKSFWTVSLVGETQQSIVRFVWQFIEKSAAVSFHSVFLTHFNYAHQHKAKNSPHMVLLNGSYKFCYIVSLIFILGLI